MRTPYGISGEIWGHVIVSCAAQTAEDIDVKELYTMIRASREKPILWGIQHSFEITRFCERCKMLQLQTKKLILNTWWNHQVLWNPRRRLRLFRRKISTSMPVCWHTVQGHFSQGRSVSVLRYNSSFFGSPPRSTSYSTTAFNVSSKLIHCDHKRALYLTHLAPVSSGLLGLLQNSEVFLLWLWGCRLL